MNEDSVKKAFKIIFGLLLIAVGISTYVTWGRWWPELVVLIKGAFGIFVIMVGLLFIFIGASE